MVNGSNLTAVFYDKNLIYKFDRYGIWKFNTLNNGYSLYYNNASFALITGEVKILSQSNRVIIYSTAIGTNEIIFYAFIDNQMGL
jgi:hypothetical protein